MPRRCGSTLRKRRRRGALGNFHRRLWVRQSVLTAQPKAGLVLSLRPPGYTGPMTILKFDQAKFERVLNEHVKPSSPVESFELLYDRDRQLDAIEEALASPGRHVFVYGDRGAGKTSLARTAAFKHHPSMSEPAYSACGKKTSFSTIIRDIASQLDGRSALEESQRATSVRVGAPHLQAGYEVTQSERDLSGLDLNAAAAAIREAATRRGGRSIIVIDEFEALPTTEDRHLFAELVKQLSDRGVPVALIFCGIGRSLDDLLHGHNSAHRYIAEVALPVPPLTYSGRWSIVDTTCSAFGVSINDDSRLRIAQVSDGFPHYVHLIMHKLLWGAFRAEHPVSKFEPEDYVDAVREALHSVESRLRSAYDDATKKYDDSYQEVLWAVADHFELDRNNRRVYADSYERIMADVGRDPLPFEDFQKRLARLRSQRHATILQSERPGWVRFSENLIRGYVRLVAEAKGVQLALEHEPGPEPKRLTASTRGSRVDPMFSRPTFGRTAGSTRKR